MTNEELVARLEGLRDELYSAHAIHGNDANLYLLYDRLRQIVEELKAPEPAEPR